MENPEEKLVYSIQCKKEIVANCKKTMDMAKIKMNEAEKDLQDTEYALVQEMKKNGVLEHEFGNYKVTLKDSYSVSVQNIDAVPEEFIRSKVVREPDKIKIRNERPTANWYSMEITTKPDIKFKKP